MNQVHMSQDVEQEEMNRHEPCGEEREHPTASQESVAPSWVRSARRTKVLCSWRLRENIVHVADAERSVFEEAQAGVGEQGGEILRDDTAVASVKMLRQPCSMFRSSRKVYGQHASAGPQDSTNLGSA